MTTPITERRRIKAAEAARILRKELAATFPGTRFSVRTKSTGLLRVSWTDGPASPAVEAIAQKYAARGFDGTIDLAYSIRHYIAPDGTIGILGSTGTTSSLGLVRPFVNMPPDGSELVELGTSYVFCSRDWSDAERARCMAATPIDPADPYGHERAAWHMFIREEGE